jgi:hypothetical protein
VRLLEKLHPADPPSLRDLANCRGWLLEFFNSQVTCHRRVFNGAKRRTAA